MDDDLWDRLAPEAGRGSSGRWTAGLGGLPVTRGGCHSEQEALQALRAAHREAMAAPNYRALAVEMAALPKPVQRNAQPTESGETMWHVRAVRGAINALADAGRIIVGLDVRDFALDGSFRETAWSSYEPTGANDVEVARTAALSALDREQLPGDWVLVTWQR